MRYLILLIAGLLLGFAAKYSFDLHRISKEKTVLQYDYSEINKVNYGLFNIQLWKDKALDIFSKKISEFNISPKAYDGLEKQVDVFIRQMFDEYITSGKLIDEIAGNLETSSKIPKMFINVVKDNVKEQMGSLDLSKQIPGITKQITSEIRKSEPELRKIMQDELMSLVLDGEETKFVERRTVIYDKYGMSDAPSSIDLISSKLKRIDTTIEELIKYILGLLGVAILLLIFTSRIVPFREFILGFTLISVVLLVLGVTLPMIDIDARLNSFQISIMDSDIEFDEQVLLFQSKSILEVTKTLWDGGGIDLKLVGILIFLFSIVFPFLKLLLSALFLYWEKAKASKFVQTIIFYLGKWSMADVFVVSMFMAYIGFHGLVTSQLGMINQNQTGYAVETINYSQLAPGALFFTSYCILSIITSIMINRKEVPSE